VSRRTESYRRQASQGFDSIRLGAFVPRRCRALLTEESWDENYELIFPVEHDTAECELLTAEMAVAENRLSMLAQRAEAPTISLPSHVCASRFTPLWIGATAAWR